MCDMGEKITLLGPNGDPIKDLDDLQENYDAEWARVRFLDGSLAAWCDFCFYEDEAEKLAHLKPDDPSLVKKLAIIFGIPYEEEEESKEIRAAKLRELKKYTEDVDVLSRVDEVAFSQEDLADLLRDGKDDILLCQGTYRIPLRRKASYRGIGDVIAVVKSKVPVDFKSLGIRFQDVRFDEAYQKIAAEGNAPSEEQAAGQREGLPAPCAAGTEEVLRENGAEVEEKGAEFEMEDAYTPFAIDVSPASVERKRQALEGRKEEYDFLWPPLSRDEDEEEKNDEKDDEAEVDEIDAFLSSFTSQKAKVCICTLGHVDHGKTTLTSAITKVLSETEGCKARFVDCDDIDRACKEGAFGLTIHAAHIEYETPSRHYTHIDCLNHADYVKTLLTNDVQIQGAILVVSAVDGVMPQTHAHVRLARQLGIPAIVVFLNKVDQVDDPKLLELVDKDVRALLTRHGFTGSNISFVYGSARKALAGDDVEQKEILRLMARGDRYIPAPEREEDKPFLLPIEDVFTVTGLGTVATGVVERGILHLNEAAEIVGFAEEKKQTIVTAIEMSRKMLDEAVAGDCISCCLRSHRKDD